MPLYAPCVQLAPEVRNQHEVGDPEILKKNGLFSKKAPIRGIATCRKLLTILKYWIWLVAHTSIFNRYPLKYLTSYLNRSSLKHIMTQGSLSPNLCSSKERRNNENDFEFASS